MSEDKAHRGPGFIKWRPLIIYLLLTASTLTVYLQVVNFDFVIMDDGDYISKNVQKGLTLENIIWSLTAQVAANWHPLTMFSHMLDCQLYGLNSGSHHLTNLFFHLANTLLLFYVLRRMTGAMWQSAFVATLFALHPLHVESVAWVAERKDVLSTFFWALTMWAYVRYVERPGFKTYFPVFVFFGLGLTAKPMIVTLPFILLLLDCWPLKRLRYAQASSWGITNQCFFLSRPILEKLPLFVLSTASCVVTYTYQKTTGAVSSFEKISFYGRIANSFLSYIKYIIKMIWPFKLAVFYPYPGILPLWQVAGAIIILALVTFLAFRSIKRHPFFAVGWFWYIGTLVPVIGLVQVGEQAMADRYTYIPLIGIFVIIAWCVPEMLVTWRYKTKFLNAVSLAVILFLIPVTWKQVRYWKNSISLFEHALDVTDNNYIAHNNLAIPLAERGRTDEAIRHLIEVLEIKPGYVTAHFNLGELLARQDKTDEAIRHLNEGLNIYPGYARAQHILGELYAKQGKTTEAIKHYLLALRISPDSRTTHTALGTALAIQGNYENAIEHLNAGLNDKTKAHFVMGNILVRKGEVSEAAAHFQEALRINKNYAEAHTNLAYVLFRQNKEDEAIQHCLEAIRIDPDKSINAYYNLACIYAKRNNIAESVDWLKKAVDKGFSDWNTLNAEKDLETIRNSPYYKEQISGKQY